MLEHLTGDIQTQILRIDHAAHKAEAVRQQISAVSMIITPEEYSCRPFLKSLV